MVVCDGRVIGHGYNHPISGHDPTAHAEIAAMRDAAKHIGNYRLIGCELYVTLEPCTMCAGAMLHARIARLVYGAPDIRAGAAGSVFDIVTDSRMNHRIEVTVGVEIEACRTLIRDFFEKRR